MNRDMNVMGVGGKIGLAALPALIVTLGLSWLFPVLRFPAAAYPALYWIGGALAVVGFSLNLLAARTMLQAHKEHRLATGGLYRVLRDPMYTLQVFLTLPGLLLLTHSWFSLLAVPFVWLVCRRFVVQEHAWLQQQFNADYDAYVAKLIIK